MFIADGESQMVMFKHIEPFAYHFHYIHAVDNHNNLRHYLASTEGSWVTTKWPLRGFAFLNGYLAMRYFIWDPNSTPTLHKLRKQLADELIHYNSLKEEEKEEEYNLRKRA
jgi:hypothetical protein